jgi:RES domain
MAVIKTVSPPGDGMWRVARGPEPFALREPSPPLRPVDREDRGIGNRFDSAMGNYYVWYCATSLQGCYGETLATFRPDQKVRRAIAGAEEGFMPIGEIPADWRKRRVATRAIFSAERPFVDVEAAETRAVLTSELGWVLDLVGLDDIDVSAIRSRDRRLTRWISEWVWQKHIEEGKPNYAGVRFCSRLNTAWECWAVFDDASPTELERHPVLRQDPALQRVANLFGLDIF